MLKTFFAVTGEGDDMVYNTGMERIPENWYRRPSSNQYTAPGNIVSACNPFHLHGMS